MSRSTPTINDQCVSTDIHVIQYPYVEQVHTYFETETLDKYIVYTFYLFEWYILTRFVRILITL